MIESWNEVKIGDLGTIITGNTPPRKNPELYGSHTLFVKPTDISEDSKYTYNPEECYSDIGYKKYIKSLIPKGSTCVVTIGSIGKKITKAHCDLFINQAMNAVIPNEKYNEEFVYYVLKYNLSQLKTFDSGTASGRENVSKSSFSNIKIKVQSDLNKQKSIGDILSRYDGLIENNLKRLEILEEMAQQTYKEWFVNGRINGIKINIENELTIIELTKNFINGGWGKEYNVNENLIPAYVIRGTDIAGISIGNFSNLPLRFHTQSNLDSRVLKAGDIIIEMSNGNINNIGRSHFISNLLLTNLKYQAICASFCKLLRAKTPDYAIMINQHIKMIYKSNAMFLYKSQAANGINNFKFELMIESESIKLPNQKDLHILSRSLKSFQNSIDNLQQQNQRLREARDILLPRLMMGMIDTSTSRLQSVETLESKPVEAKIIPLEQPKKEASKEFKEAVLIACLTEKFGSVKYPLGRKRYTKLSYLFHRYSDNKIQDYLRKAAGPYNPKTKYGGPEKIALNNKYIQNWKGDKGTTGFVAAEKIDDAKKYFSNYWQIADLDWLVTEFKFNSNDELELLATVDNSLMELSKKNMEFTSTNVLDIIKSEKEWEAKLERTIFSDLNVERAIRFLTETLQYEK